MKGKSSSAILNLRESPTEAHVKLLNFSIQDDYQIFLALLSLLIEQLIIFYLEVR